MYNEVQENVYIMGGDDPKRVHIGEGRVGAVMHKGPKECT